MAAIGNMAAPIVDLGGLVRPKASRTLFPGLAGFPADQERYPVKGGGAIVIDLRAGDRLTVIDREGRQPCQIATFGADKKSDPGLLGGAAVGDSLGLQQILGASNESARSARARLERLGISLAGAKAIGVFGEETQAGTREEWTAPG